MNTPICDFINEYAKKDTVRLHMPGHKGKSQLGFEHLDITEFYGADCLYLATGIIKESENNASSLFGSGKTLYSCEGSSLCIRSMMYLVKTYAKDGGYVLATRNAHSSFISACALNGIDVEWIFPKEEESYLSCSINGEILENHLSRVGKMPICVYVTSPDYLGNMSDISSLSSVCKKYGILLLVDNAHGAYLKFLKKDIHPISLGADMCCDSAHKTLPVLTGGAYLHISKDAPDFFKENAKAAMHLFGSTSPSYLILASLDMANKYISQGFKESLNEFADSLKEMFSDFAFCSLHSDFNNCREPLKIVIDTKKIGYRGTELSQILLSKNIMCEFYDEDFLVLMPGLENGINELEYLKQVLLSLEKKDPIIEENIPLIPPEKVMSIREATFAKKEQIPIENALNRVLAVSNITCPPAVSLIVSGEKFNESIISLCKKYGFSHCDVIK